MPPSVETPATLVNNSKITKIINGRILKNGQIVENDYLWIREGKFVDPAQLFYEENSSPDEIIDARGALVVPGFIELQLNGAYGVDFTGDYQTIEEGLKKVSKAILDQGVTSYCPTIVSSFPNVYERVLPALVPRKGSVEEGAEILGAHLEGPFMSDLKYGAHDVNTLRDAKKGITDLESVYGNLDNHNKAISLITVAPDVEGMLDAIPELAKRIPCVSLGHTAALTTVAEEGVRRGAKMVTHLFNAMNQFHHRDPGCIGLLGSSLERPFYGIICDGVHVHPNSVKIAYYSHPKGACLVTDAMAAAGLAEGSYTLGKMNVEVKGKKITIAGTDTIAGSNVKMYECVQNFKQFTGCTTVEAIEAATLHPAQVLGIENRKGTLNNGADADFLFLDNDLNLLRLFINGEEAQL